MPGGGNMVQVENISKEFQNRFGGHGKLYTAPGRVNLIGEHTDYNLGFVLPGAIDKAITLEIRPNGTKEFRVVALDYNEVVTFAADGHKLALHWANYVLGVVMEFLSRCFPVAGFDAVFAGDIPLGGGLSSSAALESAFAFAINDLGGFGVSRLELAQIGQSAEHKYAGVRCGIMDQFASLHGKQDKLLKLDCRSLEYELIPFHLPRYRVVLLDTQVKHSLAASEYNLRRAQCEAGVKILQQSNSDVQSLRDGDLSLLEACRTQMDATVHARCRYVIEENIRVLRAVDLLKAADAVAFGREMFLSHEGLQHQYAVSCPELDLLVDAARQVQGVAGARMMGGGFGGCTINLVAEDVHDEFVRFAQNRFEKQFGKIPVVYDVTIGEGARLLA